MGDKRISVLKNPCSRKREADISRFGKEVAENARRFHSGFSEYSPTPLVNLKEYAERKKYAEYI